MTILTSLIAKSTGGAVVEIIILLLVAGVIAYLTAYYYYKSVYTKKIQALEKEKGDLQMKISGLESEIRILSTKLEEQEKAKE